ncbi:MAG: ABC transporter substrate-binding protein [Pseudomonadota bacterium]
MTDGPETRLTRRGALQLSVAALATPFLARASRAATALSFQCDWKANAQFAGLFLAKAEGLYADAGLDVEIRPWADGINVAEGRRPGPRRHGLCRAESDPGRPGGWRAD